MLGFSGFAISHLHALLQVKGKQFSKNSVGSPLYLLLYKLLLLLYCSTGYVGRQRIETLVLDTGFYNLQYITKIFCSTNTLDKPSPSNSTQLQSTTVMASKSHLHLFPLILRTTQTILTLTSLILYAQAYATALSTSSDNDTSSYVYALICCTTTLFTLLVYTIPSFPTHKLFLWDFCLGVLWAALSGVFGMRYFRDDGGEYGRKGNRTAMKAAVGIDLVVMGCWIITCLWGCVGIVRAKAQMGRQRREGKEVEKMLEGQEQGTVEVEWDDGDEEDEECKKVVMREKM
jgi:hypothetical protein